MQLSPQEAAKVARLWIPVAGHLYVDPDDSEAWYRALEVFEGVASEWIDDGGQFFSAHGTDVWPARFVPCYRGDHATTDGLPRSVRAAWNDETAHCYYSLAGKWKVAAHVRGGEHIFEGATEAEAWIAALLAAPEAM